MRKTWQSAVLAALAVSTAAVLLWSGVLAFRWYEGYKLGVLIAIDCTVDQNPGNLVQGAQARMQAWQDFWTRKDEVRVSLSKLNDWQRSVALATAFERWHACDPRPIFGTWHLWKLFNEHKAFEWMERVLDLPV